jgi:hypothetical protein
VSSTSPAQAGRRPAVAQRDAGVDRTALRETPPGKGSPAVASPVRWPAPAACVAGAVRPWPPARLRAPASRRHPRAASAP